MGTQEDPRGGPGSYGYQQPRYAQPRNMIGMLGNMLARKRDASEFRGIREQFIEFGARRFEAMGSEEATEIAKQFRSDPKGTYGFFQQYGGIGKFEDRLKEQAEKKHQAEMLRRRGDVARGYFDSLPEGQEPRSMDLLEAGIQAEIPAELMQGVTSLVEAYEAPVPPGLT